MSNQSQIDWSQHDGDEQARCECRCGVAFMSHYKRVKVGDELVAISRKPCPNCGATDRIRHVSSPPERFTIRGDQGFNCQDV